MVDGEILETEDEEPWFPFSDAFEEDTGTYPFGTLSKYASHVESQRETIKAALILSSCNKETTLLDFGCGAGRVTSTAASTIGCNVMGIDFCEGELVKARLLSEKLGVTHLSTYVNCDVVDYSTHLPMDFDYGHLVIYIHLIPTQLASRRIRSCLEQAIDNGAKVVTVRYHPPEESGKEVWTPKAIDVTAGVQLYHA